MMRQYQSIKEQYPDAFLFFRLGDFYEMFGEDAIVASRELEITLTARDGGMEERIPMCGVPYHAAEGYISRLVSKGFKVAICEQVEEAGKGKGIVKREVVRLVTPGTITDATTLEDKTNNFLVALARNQGDWGLSAIDVLTGDFYVTYWPEKESIGLQGELARLSPKEIVITTQLAEQEPTLTKEWTAQGFIITLAKESFSLEQARKLLKKHFGVSSLEAYGCAQWPAGLLSAAVALHYVQETQKTTLQHISALQSYSTEQFMRLDTATRRNLELTQTMRDGVKKGSLLGVIDKTVTAMGGRLLKRWLEQPLIKLSEIKERQKYIKALVDDGLIRESVREALKSVYDLERLCGKISYGSANGRDLIALASSLEALPPVLKQLQEGEAALQELAKLIDPQVEIATEIRQALLDDPPFSIREGALIRTGYHEDVDELHNIAGTGKEWLTHLERRERERTGIKSLKIGYNKVFGYYIEVTRSNLAHVPDDYIRKQTLSNGERYITKELKEYEDKIIGAEDKLIQLEYSLFIDLREAIEKKLPQLQQTAKGVAQLDTLLSLAQIAVEGAYTCPEVNNSDQIEIYGGRHPVVEEHVGPGVFVPNDTLLDQQQRLLLITGPNMAGKSTYMRQVALIVLMAQIGSFVPASACSIGVVDRIFTRVGASDDLATGQSTFMVEMTEVAHILHHATDQSLIILDEVGRGTSTFDGMAIAWSVAEAIQQRQSKALFATHYHELVQLEKTLSGICCYNIAIDEVGDEIVFLHQIRPGGVDKSYGIQVARLAGLPDEVINRAREILATLEQEGIDKEETLPVVREEKSKEKAQVTEQEQLALFYGTLPERKVVPSVDSTVNKMVTELKKLDINNLTPLESLNWLAKWQKKV
ncbi:DNA mismatch repair protein MutS [Heliorestis acidaminivorans]|uniref:DNA mismatch repair protein MutS n=2 Tax=Heliorestis acidaminivorans TaxID=553427 RepID=A0A6I0FB02_9FIRM|nr:DNA mismatch repair protein MutS [Heliorestis acidaminivorans]